MTKQNFKQRSIKGIAIAICLAATTMFSACGDDGNDPEDGGAVQIEIKNLFVHNASDGCMIEFIYTKPAQWAGVLSGMSDGYLTAESPKTNLTNSVETTGREGYICLTLISGILKNGYYYQHFISKNKATLKDGLNTFDFGTDFEILHEYGGTGILRIEGVPAEYTTSVNVQHIYEHLGTTGEYDGYSKKPLGEMGDPQNFPYGYYGDYLSIPLQGFKNQVLDYYVGVWSYDLTGRRFDQSGTFLIEMTGFNDGPTILYYAEANFTNGRATVQWGDFKHE
jgi:hypothetical protein